MKYDYKNTGIEWLGEIPEHWYDKRLFNICTFVRGNSPFQKNELLSKGEYVALQYGKTYKVDEVNEQFNFYVNDEFYNSSQTANYGDVIFVSTSETMEDLGHSVFYNRKDIGLIGGEQILLKPNKNILDGKYLYYSTKVFGKELNKFATGIKVFRFDIYDLKTIYTPLPPLPEQKAIADYLDKACQRIDNIIEVKQKQLEKIEGYFTTRIIEATTKGLRKDVNLKAVKSDWIKGVPVHWKVKKIKRLAKIFRGKFTHRPRNDERLYDGDYPFIQTGSVTNAKKYINEYHQTLNEWGKSVSELFPAGTLTMTIAANIADVAILNFDACFPDSIVGFKPQHFIELEFLYYLFIALRQDFLGTAIITTQMNLNVVRIGDIEGFAPPKEEQLEIIEYLKNLSTRIDNLKQNINDQISSLHTYRKSLIHECVTGKKQVWEGEIEKAN